MKDNKKNCIFLKMEFSKLSKMTRESVILSKRDFQNNLFLFLKNRLYLLKVSLYQKNVIFQFYLQRVMLSKVERINEFFSKLDF